MRGVFKGSVARTVTTVGNNSVTCGIQVMGGLGPSYRLTSALSPMESTARL